MKNLEEGLVWYQSKLDLRKNGGLTESEYYFIDEVKRSCAFYFCKDNRRFVLTASYANADKTPPEYYISDLQTRRREQVSDLEIAKRELLKLASGHDCCHYESMDDNISITDKIVQKSSERQTRSTVATESNSKISDLWNSGDEAMWRDALGSYWDRFNDNQYRLEKKIESIEASDIKLLSVYDFYGFLYQLYFPWKFTNNLFLSGNRKHLEKYLLDNEIEKLSEIQDQLFKLNFEDIKECLTVASSIHGLHTAGGSGLLSILFPEHFATVDRYVVYALLKIDGLKEYATISRMNPESLTLNDGVTLIELMRRKAKELNARFQTDFWTPRKIDMVLWAVR